MPSGPATFSALMLSLYLCFIGGQHKVGGRGSVGRWLGGRDMKKRRRRSVSWRLCRGTLFCCICSSILLLYSALPSLIFLFNSFCTATRLSSFPDLKALFLSRAFITEFIHGLLLEKQSWWLHCSTHRGFQCCPTQYFQNSQLGDDSIYDPFLGGVLRYMHPWCWYIISTFVFSVLCCMTHCERRAQEHGCYSHKNKYGTVITHNKQHDIIHNIKHSHTQSNSPNIVVTAECRTVASLSAKEKKLPCWIIRFLAKG